jgi:unspecific monooxygenase
MQASIPAEPSTRLVPPFPAAAPDDLSGFALARVMRVNALRIWPERAYREDVLQRRFFGRSTFLISNPDAIRRVLIDNHENYGRTRATIRVLKPLLGDGLFISEGRAWKRQRRTLAPAFTPKASDAFAGHMVAAAAQRIAELDGRTGEPLDLYAIIQRLTLEIAGRTMFSLEMRDQGAVLRHFMWRYTRSLARPNLLDFVLPLGVPTPHDLGRWWFRRGWVRFIDGILEKRATASPHAAPRDLLDLLLAAVDPDTGRGFAPAEVRDQVATMIIAGHETTAVALFWCLYILALAPDMQERVAAECRAAAPLGSARPAYEQLVYTGAVVAETLRLYPPAYVIVRMVRAPDMLCGAEVRPGDIILISPWVIHRHARLWRDAHAFDPQRFMPGAPAPPRFSYLPFGVGPRVCIGAQFALLEATIVLSHLLTTFRIELADSGPVTPTAIITTQPDRPPLFRLHPR